MSFLSDVSLFAALLNLICAYPLESDCDVIQEPAQPTKTTTQKEGHNEGKLINDNPIGTYMYMIIQLTGWTSGGIHKIVSTWR